MASYWSSLPADLLRLVSDCLTSERDLIHVRQVCTHWRASAPLPVAPYRPWVVATRVCLANPVRRQVPIGDYSLWLLAGLRRIQLAGPPGLPYCCGTPRGWLALADDEQSPTRLVLWEPCSGAEIRLPPLTDVLQVFLSADPLASASSSGWMAVATQARECVFHNLFFWRPGDAAWSAVAEVYACERLHSVAFHGGNMYCMDSFTNLDVYDLNLGTTTGSPPVLLRRMYVAYEIHGLCNRRCGKTVHGARAAHFVTCNGELLLVVLFHDRHPSFAEVYRPSNNLLMPGSVLELGERVMDLGGYSLFLGRGDAFALAAHEFPAAAIRRNCIYYAVHVLNYMRHWVFVFDLETDALEKFPFPQEREGDSGKARWPISWFCPKRPIVKLDDDHIHKACTFAYRPS